MSTALVLGSLCLLLLAAAIELWWAVPSRILRTATGQRTSEALNQRRGDPGVVAADPPSRRARVATSHGLPWDGLLLRARLPTGWRVPTIVLLVGLAIAVVAAARIGSAWMLPIALATYAATVWFWLHRRMDKMQRTLLVQIPDFLEHMVRLNTLGRSLPTAFQEAGNHVQPPFRAIVDHTMRNVRGGMDIDRALEVASAPYKLQALNVLSAVLGICIRVGGRSGHILQRMGDFMRDLTQAQNELHATTAETRASAWVLGLLPPLSALLMAVVSPDFLMPLIEHPLGVKIVIAAVALEVLGIGLLYRLAKSL